VLRKKDLHKVTGFHVVASESGLILCDNVVDLSVLYITYHTLERWTIKIRAGISIVNVIVMDEDAVLIAVVGE
jgi:hypothetical protein